MNYAMDGIAPFVAWVIMLEKYITQDFVHQDKECSLMKI